MLPETVKAITAIWNETTISKQKALIRSYLEQYGTSEKGQWMEFLLDQFNLEDNGSFITPRSKKVTCRNNCTV